MDLPFAAHPLVRAETIDKARIAFAQLYCRAVFDVPRQTSSFRWSANGISLGKVLLAAGSIDSDVTIHAETQLDSVIFTWAHEGFANMHLQHQDYVIGQGRGVLAGPSRSQGLSIRGPYRPITLRIDYAALNDTLYALTGIGSAAPLEFDATFDPSRPHSREILRLFQFIAQTLEQDPSPLAHPFVLSNLQNSLLSAVVLCQPHNHRSLLEQGVPTPSQRMIQRVEAYLDANASTPISMADLHAETGASVRAIQAAFKAKRGCSPMEFLRERRLLLAQQRLQAATPGTKVAEVAYSCGFGHLGRFSREYFKRFGEKPSVTLARTLQGMSGSVEKPKASKLTGSRH